MARGRAEFFRGFHKEKQINSWNKFWLRARVNKKEGKGKNVENDAEEKV